jgi:hypothetical protein
MILDQRIRAYLTVRQIHRLELPPDREKTSSESGAEVRQEVA